MNAINTLEYSIIKTICFFDVFDYPLTATEIWKWLLRPARPYSLLEVRNALQNSIILKDKLGHREGFYSLTGREFICQKRKHNNNVAEHKFTQALRVAQFFKYIPFVRMIAVCNTLAYSNAGDDSDIDFFIIAKSGRIWLARFFTILLVKMFGKRPKPGAHRDAICLSFFIDERQLDIRRIMFGQNDIYTPYWIQQLLPIYDPDGLYSRFMEANAWYKEYLPNGYKNDFVNRIEPTGWHRTLASVLGWLATPPLIRGLINSFYRRVQVKIIDRNLSSIVNIDTRVIVNEMMLKFHAIDRREDYYKKWRDSVNNLLGDYEKTKTTVI